LPPNRGRGGGAIGALGEALVEHDGLLCPFG
jgi:hypothetical protein